AQPEARGAGGKGRDGGNRLINVALDFSTEEGGWYGDVRIARRCRTTTGPPLERKGPSGRPSAGIAARRRGRGGGGGPYAARAVGRSHRPEDRAPAAPRICRRRPGGERSGGIG